MPTISWLIIMFLMTIAIKWGAAKFPGEKTNYCCNDRKKTGVSAGKGPPSWSDFQVPCLEDEAEIPETLGFYVISKQRIYRNLLQYIQTCPVFCFGANWDHATPRRMLTDRRKI